MSAARNEAMIRRWFEEVWNNRNRGVIDELMHHDALVHGLSPDGQPARGRAGFMPFYESFMAAFPNIRIVIDDVIADEERVVARMHAEATHDGAGLGIAATGRPVKFTAIVWARIRDGQLLEAWNELDTVGMLRQVGAM